MLNRFTGAATERLTSGRAFLSGPGHYAGLGGMDCEDGDDPNFQDYDGGLSCYFDWNEEDPVFPFHWDCYLTFCQCLTGSHDLDRIDKDVLYNTMRSLTSDYDTCLHLDYNETGTDACLYVDQYWEARPGGELLVASPSKSPKVSASVKARLERGLQLTRLDENLGCKVRSDPFSRLAHEVSDQIISYLDHSSLVNLFRASWSLHSSYHGNDKFWRQRIRHTLDWFFELEDALQSGDTKCDLKAVYLWAMKISEPYWGKKGRYLGITNRRRIWGVCRQLVDQYMEKMPAEPQNVDSALRKVATCPYMPLVTWPTITDVDLDTVYWLSSWDDLYAPKLVQTYWDTDGDLTGISVTIDDDERLFGGNAVPDENVQSFQLEGKDWIDGIIIHIPKLNSFMAKSSSASPKGISVSYNSSARIN